MSGVATWRAGAGAQRPRQDRRRAFLVAQPIDEDAALAALLAHGGDEALRLMGRQRLRETLGERLRLLVIDAAVEGRDDMHALAAGEQRPGLEADLLQRLGDVGGGALDLVEGQALVGIEVEHHAVGRVEGADAAHPAVQFDGAELRRRMQAERAVERHIGLRADLDGNDSGLHAAQGMALEERLGDRLRRAHDGQRPIGEMRRETLGDRVVIGRDLALGDAVGGIDDPVGVGDRGGLRSWFGGFHGQILAQRQEARLTQMALAGPAAEADLGAQRLFDELHALRPVADESRRAAWSEAPARNPGEDRARCAAL